MKKKVSSHEGEDVPSLVITKFFSLCLFFFPFPQQGKQANISKIALLEMKGTRKTAVGYSGWI